MFQADKNTAFPTTFQCDVYHFETDRGLKPTQPEAVLTKTEKDDITTYIVNFGAPTLIHVTVNKFYTPILSHAPDSLYGTC